MTETQYLLTCLAEECAEVAQRASKAIRFGLGEIQPGQELNNAERIMVEYGDLQGVIDMLQASQLLPPAYPNQSFEKMAKVRKYMAYSRSLGVMETSSDPLLEAKNENFEGVKSPKEITNNE